MAKKTVEELFKEKFEDYHVIVNPPCISWYREFQYIEEAMRVCLGENGASRGNIKIDHENKKVWYNR